MGSMAMQHDRVSKHGRGWAAELQTVFHIQIVPCSRMVQDLNQDQDLNQEQDLKQDQAAARSGLHDGGQTAGTARSHVTFSRKKKLETLELVSSVGKFVV